MEFFSSVSICTLMKVSDDFFLFLVSSVVHHIPLPDLKPGCKSYSYFSLSQFITIGQNLWSCQAKDIEFIFFKCFFS